jgi:hypothetical protein
MHVWQLRDQNQTKRGASKAKQPENEGGFGLLEIGSESALVDHFLNM